MKSRNRFAYLIAMCIFLLTNGCSKNNVDLPFDCEAQEKKIEKSKADFFANPNTDNCQTVVSDYDLYISKGCDTDGSYQNLRDAFKDAHCK